MHTGPSEQGKKKTGVWTEAHPTNSLLLYVHVPLPPTEALPCRKLQCGRGPIVCRSAAEEKGPLVVNNSAVHSDHSGGTSHCFEHLLQEGVGPLAAQQRCPNVRGVRLNP